MTVPYLSYLSLFVYFSPEEVAVIHHRGLRVTFKPATGRRTIAQGWFSPGYGVRLPSRRIAIDGPFCTENRFCIEWSRG